MRDLTSTIEEAIYCRRLFPRGQPVLVAVSGGLDSMVLLHVLSTLSERHVWRLVVAHFNHRLRGRASDADEAFVKRAAKSLRLPFVSKRGDVKRFARDHKLSVEMAGRKLRHEFFARVCSKMEIRKVALAHHADDQIELFFLRLLRGAGSEGLGGMDWAGPSPSDPTIVLVRPLLGIRKDDLLTYARAQRIGFREDATNASLEHRRNRIRHELLPLLRAEYQPALSKVILRETELFRSEADFISEMARLWKVKSALPPGGGRDPRLSPSQPENRSPARRTELPPWRGIVGPDRPIEHSRIGRLPFDELHPAVQRRVLQMDLRKLGVLPEFDLVERLRVSSGEVIIVASQLGVWRDENGDVRSRPITQFEFKPDRAVLDLGVTPGCVSFEGIRISWQIHNGSKTNAPLAGRTEACEHFDALKVGSPVFLRHWQPGDRFHPIGMPKAVQVQDLFTNAKIPRERRHELILATTARDEIFWIEGFRMSEPFKLDRKTPRRLQWNWLRG